MHNFNELILKQNRYQYTGAVQWNDILNSIKKTI